MLLSLIHSILCFYLSGGKSFETFKTEIKISNQLAAQDTARYFFIPRIGQICIVELI